MTYTQKGLVPLKLFSKLNFQKLFPKSNRSSMRLLVDDAPISTYSDKSIDIILSPKFYWVKLESLPVKFTHQAKSYAESIFEGAIPDGAYSYAVRKVGDKFCFFAYNDAQILEQLSHLGLNQSMIGNVYFAQTELANLDNPIILSDTHALITHEEIVIKVPRSIASNAQPFERVQSTLNPSNFRINLHKINQWIEPKKLTTLFVLLSLLILAFGGHYFYLYQAHKNQSNALASIRQDYKLPPTNIQLEALYKQLSNTDNSQKALRESINNVLKSPLNKGEFITQLNLEDKKINLKAQLSQPKRAEAIKAYLEKHFSVLSMKVAGNILEAELEYE